MLGERCHVFSICADLSNLRLKSHCPNAPGNFMTADTLANERRLLDGNILCHFPNPGVRNRKDSIATTPCEFIRQQVALVYPMRGTALKKLHHLFNTQSCGQVHQNMHVIGIHEIDLHIDRFLRGVLGQIARDFGRCRLGQKRLAFHCGPDQAQPNARVRM